MARETNTQTPVVENPDVETPTGEVDTPNPAEASGEGEKPEKAKKEPARGDLPEGYVTPVGLAHELGKRGLQTNRDGEVLTEVKPQMVYSYIKNASKEDPFPIETVKDSIGKERQALKLDAGIAWWERKNERAKARKESAAAKEAAKAEKAAKAEADKAAGATEAEGAEGETPVTTEAE